MVVKRPAQSWGRVHRFEQKVLAAADLPAALLAGNESVLPYGLGRSYGDSCLNESGILLATEKLDPFIAFDRERGLLTCEAGVALRDILLLCAIPNADGSYWFPAVAPGTKFVTVGGAIANDIHGKNHHRQGTFGKHVVSFRLRRSDGAVRTCSPTEHAGLFHATIGGLGLTGLIEEVTLQFMRVTGLRMEVEEIVLKDLDGFYRTSAESEGEWEHTVAWVDCLGRGIFSRARHIAGEAPRTNLLPKLSVPWAPVISPINRLTVAAFNALYRRKLRGADVKKSVVPYDRFLFPLDDLRHWNRLYGRAGFYQYQCVIPAARAHGVIHRQLEQIARSAERSFLIVLKTFGNVPSPGMLSFPMPGTTLTIDLPNRGAPTLALLDSLDALTLEAGGRVYPAKDGRMASSTFARYYPQEKDFAAWIDPRFSSSFWRRVHR